MKRLGILVMAMVLVIVMSAGVMADNPWDETSDNFKIELDTPEEISINGLEDMDFGTVFQVGAEASADFQATADSDWSKNLYANIPDEVQLTNSGTNGALVSLKPGWYNDTIAPGNSYEITGEVEAIHSTANADTTYNATVPLTVSYFEIQ